ncbi:hypothetical protein I5U32_01020 [Stenotrophomonas maltophilia]|uniref:hypothetical protein n=1 Tax=Stenotrophomonas TaxID=40323 RepID=UPI0018D2D915|nr:MULTISPECIES: hypothetical protein [Stenotrophomonas]MBH1380112.1 hypothetical protein [Stenotrophomonas maltophilia]MBH1396597.1 hypothetical protein [Stenotrophomonas maltophilia]MBH1472821.1 hypothetical protein [Stenotrophomonas maltophilia]MBH1497653.1 hypothetical protein [Stenotrophomonas maltophilia]MBH1534091.1 hypothetical protein [Stenotrophomonas maltophilia]
MEWGSTGVTLFFVVMGLVVTVLWIFVPFAIFGIKPLLQGILVELRRANAIAEARDPGVAASSPSVTPAREAEPHGALATMRAAIRQADRP